MSTLKPLLAHPDEPAAGPAPSRRGSQRPLRRARPALRGAAGRTQAHRPRPRTGGDGSRFAGAGHSSGQGLQGAARRRASRHADPSKRRKKGCARAKVARQWGMHSLRECGAEPHSRSECATQRAALAPRVLYPTIHTLPVARRPSRSLSCAIDRFRALEGNLSMNRFRLRPPPPGPRAASARCRARCARHRRQAATPAETLKVAKGFKVELLYSVPKDRQGSWVNMCVDPKGRLIVSDQYGGALPHHAAAHRRQGRGHEGREARPADIGEAQGLLWAFDSLYVVVNDAASKYDSGLYRVTRHGRRRHARQGRAAARRSTAAASTAPHAVLLAPGRQVALRRLRQPDEADRSSTRIARAAALGRGPPAAAHARRQRLHGRRARAGRLHLQGRPRRQELGAVQHRLPQRVRRRLQPPRRAVHLRRRHGVGHQHAVVSADARLPRRPAAASSAGATAPASGRRTTPTACPPSSTSAPARRPA